jgi:Family of unknown function (DUF6338)
MPPDQKSRLLSAIVASAWLYAALSPVVYLLFRFQIPGQHPVWFALAVFVALFVYPVAVGFGLGRLVLWERGRRFLNWLRIRHPSPCAWDHIFARGEPLFIIATLDDGTLIAGTWSADAFAGDSGPTPDIYLDTQFALSADGTPQGPLPDSRGCYLQLARVRCLEFRAMTRVLEGDVDGHEEDSGPAAITGGLPGRAPTTGPGGADPEGVQAEPGGGDHSPERAEAVRNRGGPPDPAA